jgi:hypothetical protein
VIFVVKVLVAVRLPLNMASDLKKLALDNKISQAEIVSEGIALFQMKLLYRQSRGEPEKQGCYTKIERQNGGFS